MQLDYEVLANYNDQCGECPGWDPQRRVVYWTDLQGRRFYCYDPASGKSQILNARLEIKGFRLNKPGCFVITNTEGIWWDGEQSLTPIVRQIDGFSCEMNDCVADARGRLLAGSVHYKPDGGYQLGNLISVRTNGKAIILDHGFHLANGLALSLDDKLLYFTNSIAGSGSGS
jgi:sugar lactone lactonase YvrE